MNRAAKYLLISFMLLILGFVLSVTQPLWLAPPWIRVTPFIYTLLTIVWLPLFLYSLWILLKNKRQLFFFLVLIFLTGQCCLILTLSPAELGYLGIYGGEHPVLGGHFMCKESEPHSLTCNLCIISSDNPPETLRIYKFKQFSGLPFMRLTNSSVEYHHEWRDPPCASP